MVALTRIFLMKPVLILAWIITPLQAFHIISTTDARSSRLQASSRVSPQQAQLLQQYGKREDKNDMERKVDVRSVNYFISRQCNYSCKFCFHTATNNHKLSLEEAATGLALLQKAGTKKINFAGGEPFLNPELLGELCRISFELGMAVSIISNGSLIRADWMHKYGEYVDVLGVSCDSFSPETNIAIGRGGDGNNQHVQRVLAVRDLCLQHQIKFKINTVVCSLNWEEDMTEKISLLGPVRWKVFQVLLLQGENSGGTGDLRDARPLTVSDSQFQSFVDRHSSLKDVMVPEPNNVMQNSYLLLDEQLRFLDCSKGGKVPSESILTVGVEKALQQAGFDQTMFEERGGVYDWTRDRSSTKQPIMDPRTQE